MTKPLQGIELIDCAKANAKQGVDAAASQCGYQGDTQAFTTNLKQACQARGIEIQQLSDLITDQQIRREYGEVEIAPESETEL